MPARGYELLTIARLPFPRRPSRAALRFPGALRARGRRGARDHPRPRRRCRRRLRRLRDALPPTSPRARRARRWPSTRRTPGPASPIGSGRGSPNSSGSRSAARASAAREFVGMPLRPEIERLDRFAARREALALLRSRCRRSPSCSSPAARPARAHQRHDRASRSPLILGTGWQVLHITGEYRDEIDPSLAGLSRAQVLRPHGPRARRRRPRAVDAPGTSTVGEVTRSGHPRACSCRTRSATASSASTRARPSRRGAPESSSDADFTPAWVAAELVPLLRRPRHDRRDGGAHRDGRGARRHRPDGRPRSTGRSPRGRVESIPMIKPDSRPPLPAELGSVHFVGIGGSGMSGIARLFLAAGHRVTGSDRTENDNTEQLRALGRDGVHRARRRARRRRRHARLHRRAVAGQPGVPGGGAPWHPGAASLAGARLARAGASVSSRSPALTARRPRRA